MTSTSISTHSEGFQIANLTDELLFSIFFESSISDSINENNIESAIAIIKNLSEVSRKFNDLSNDEPLWKKLAQTRDLLSLGNLTWKNTSKFYYLIDQLRGSIDKIEDLEKKAEAQISLISLYPANNGSALESSSSIKTEIEKAKTYINSIDNENNKERSFFKLLIQYIRLKKVAEAESLYNFFKDVGLKNKATKKLFYLYLEIKNPEKAKKILSDNFKTLNNPYKLEDALFHYYLNNKQIDKAKEFSNPHYMIELYKVYPEKELLDDIKSLLNTGDIYSIKSSAFEPNSSDKKDFLSELFRAFIQTNNLDEAVALIDKIDDDIEFKLDLQLQLIQVFKNDIQIQKTRDLINQLHNSYKAIYQIRFMQISPTNIEIDKAIALTNETEDSLWKERAQKSLLNALIELKEDKKAKDFITAIRKNKDHESLFHILNACLQLKDTDQAKDLTNEIYADMDDPNGKALQQIELLKVYLELKNLKNAYELINDIKVSYYKLKAQMVLLDTLIKLKDIEKIKALISAIYDLESKAIAQIKLLSINPIDDEIELAKKYIIDISKSDDSAKDLYEARSLRELSNTLLKLNKLDEAKLVVLNMENIFTYEKEQACIEFIQKAIQLNEIKKAKDFIKEISDPYRRAQMQAEFMKRYFQLD